MNNKIEAKCDRLAEEIAWLPIDQQAWCILYMIKQLEHGVREDFYIKMLEEIDTAIEARVSDGEWYAD